MTSEKVYFAPSHNLLYHFVTLCLQPVNILKFSILWSKTNKVISIMQILHETLSQKLFFMKEVFKRLARVKSGNSEKALLFLKLYVSMIIKDYMIRYLGFISLNLSSQVLAKKYGTRTGVAELCVFQQGVILF